MTGRDRIVLLAVLALAAVAGAWMLVIQPKRSQAGTLAAQVQTLQSQLAATQSKVTAGLTARGQYASDYTEVARLGEALPQSDEVPTLIYQIQSAASAAGVDFRTLSMSPASGQTSTASGSSLPPGASVGPAGFPVEQFNFSFTGDFFNLSNFFARLQRFVVAGAKQISVSGRLLSLNGFSFSVGPAGFPQISATVSATTYMAPASSDALSTATAAGPTASTSTPASGSSGTAAAAITSPIR